MSLASLTAQPRKLTVAGQDYLLHPLTLDDLGQLQGWIDSHFPDPFQVVGKAIATGNYNVAQQQYLLSQALERSIRPKNLIGTPDADRLLQTVDGTVQMLLLSIRKGRPEFSQSEAAELTRQLGLGDIQAAFAVTGVSMVMSDPKDETKISKPSGNTTSRSRRRARKGSTGGSSTTKS
jgi:hypothetical protein